MSGKKGRSGKHKYKLSNETIEKQRKAYYKWSGRQDPQKCVNDVGQNFIVKDVTDLQTTWTTSSLDVLQECGGNVKSILQKVLHARPM